MDESVLSTMPSMWSDILRPAVLSVQVAQKLTSSDDYSQQLLSIDHALKALRASREELMSKLMNRMYTSWKKAPEVVYRSRIELDRLIEKFGALQLEARDNFNAQWLLRKGRESIAGFPAQGIPEEVLRNVFEYFRGDLRSHPFSPDPNDKAGTVNIQNFRLVNKEFCRASSHLLIRYLDVSLTRSSLKRLENIMDRKAISEGSRLLRLDLRCYETRNLREFALMCHHKMETATRALEAALRKSRAKQQTTSVSELGSQHAGISETMWGDGMPEDVVSEAGTSEDDIWEDTESEDDVSEDDPLANIGLPPSVGPWRWTPEFSFNVAALEGDALEEMVAKAQHILSSWQPLAYTEGIAADDVEHLDEAVHALLNGHEHYCALVREQNELLLGGHFEQAVATAMAKGHSGGRRNLWLYMWDDEDINNNIEYEASARRAALDPSCLADLDLLIQSHMIQPSSWSHTDRPPLNLLYDLPLAMRSAGVSLAGLKVKVHDDFMFRLNMSQVQLEGLREVAETLDIFDFRLESGGFWRRIPGAENQESLVNLYNYVSAAVGE